jgi:hypothetical protein
MRVGTAPVVYKLLLLVVAAAIAVGAWRLATKARPTEPGDPLLVGLWATTTVAALLVASPILSPQYIAWLLPWAAIAAASGERLLGGIALSISLLTSLMWSLPTSSGNAFGSLLLMRNISLVALLVVGLLRLRRFRDASLQAGQLALH